ncbi:MAG TPA: hypothetical protein VFX49_11685 [Chloroflexota bacterium]|nr:hypothetical protein [Chloroflexota bacterium]
MPLFLPQVPPGTQMGQFPVWDQTNRRWQTVTLTDGFEPTPTQTYRISALNSGDVQLRAANVALGWNPAGRLTFGDYGFNTQGGMRHNTVATTDATVTTLYTETLTDPVTHMVIAQVVADQSAGASSAGYLLAATIKRTGGGVATLVGAVTALATHEDVAAWNATIDVDGANSYRIRVTGAAGTNITWRCIVQYVQQVG